MVTMSTLPQRSPLPNRQPSTRWAPAITASSAAATPVPRSLSGVYRQHDVLARAQVAVHPLDLVGKHVGRGVLDGGGQVDDDRGGRASAPQAAMAAWQASEGNIAARWR